MQTILSGTLASSGYSYVLQMSALQGGKYEVVVGDKGNKLSGLEVELLQPVDRKFKMETRGPFRKQKPALKSRSIKLTSQEPSPRRNRTCFVYHYYYRQ